MMKSQHMKILGLSTDINSVTSFLFIGKKSWSVNELRDILDGYKRKGGDKAWG